MKKFLLTSTLILALVVSLTAGTMAAYNQNVATVTSEATARVMNVSASAGAEGYNTEIALAPGDSATETITLNNDGDVTADVKLVAALTGVQSGTFNGLTVEVEKVSGDAEATVTGNGTAVSTATAQLAYQKTVTYKITVTWPYDANTKDTFETDGEINTFNLEVGVNAVSVNEAKIDV